MNSNQSIDELKTLTEKYPPKKCKTSTGIFTYYSAGKGDLAVLLLPGGMGDGEVYFFSMFGLSKLYRLIAITYPNPALSKLSSYVTGIIELLQSEGIKTFCPCGHSFGGVITQQLVRKVPDMIPKFILSHTAGVHTQMSKKSRKARIIQLKKARMLFKIIPSFLLNRIRSKKLEKKIDAMNTEEATFWKNYFLNQFSMIKKQHQLALLDTLLDFAESYSFTSQDLLNWNGEILIVDSNGDTAIPPEEKEGVRKLYPQANIKTFKEFSHLAIISERKIYQQVFLDFLSS